MISPVLTICQSILMPPPAKPNSNRSLQRSLHQSEDGHHSSPFFSRAIQDGTIKIVAQAGKKREIESDDETSSPSIFPMPAVPANKRPNKNGREKYNVRSETKKPAKSSAKQAVGGEHETLFQFESSQRIQRPSLDLDYEEYRLHDKVSREEASIFRSAKSYGQLVEKRRRLGD